MIHYACKDRQSERFHISNSASWVALSGCTFCPMALSPSSSSDVMATREQETCSQCPVFKSCLLMPSALSAVEEILLCDQSSAESHRDIAGLWVLSAAS